MQKARTANRPDFLFLYGRTFAAANVPGMVAAGRQPSDAFSVFWFLDMWDRRLRVFRFPVIWKYCPLTCEYCPLRVKYCPLGAKYCPLDSKYCPLGLSVRNRLYLRVNRKGGWAHNIISRSLIFHYLAILAKFPEILSNFLSQPAKFFIA